MSIVANPYETKAVTSGAVTLPAKPLEVSTQADLPPYNGHPWPAPVKSEAYHGLAGEIIQRIEPHTEADSVALLVQLLLAFGNAVGRSAHWSAEATPHFTNEFAVIVGESSTSRKGTSHDRIIETIFASADFAWTQRCIASGLVSGEGIIHAIRDPSHDSEGHCEDSGVTDKRLYAAEGEFAQVLASIGRKDNTLSVIIRHLWDGKTLRTLTKNSGKGAAVSTAPHGTIVGHITADELKRKLAATDAANGLANRFLWICAKRSKLLPFGGSLTAEQCQDLAKRISEALALAKTCGEVGFTADAATLWEAQYGLLSQNRAGILGQITSRAPAHVRRLALIYALMDKRDVVDIEHLKAALALWAYSLASAEYIFGGLSLAAREIHERLRLAFPDELARTDIHNSLGRHARADELTRALAELARTGLAISRKESSGGAPRELWKAVAK